MTFWRTRRLELAIVAAVVAADQGTKTLVARALDLHESVAVIPGLLNLTHVRNTGAAFGILNAVDFPYKPLVMALVAMAALIAITAYALHTASGELLPRVGLALVLGGAAGNLIDRVTAGYVIDFVDVYWRSYHFWAFNVADACITVGASALVLDLLGLGRHASNPR